MCFRDTRNHAKRVLPRGPSCGPAAVHHQSHRHRGDWWHPPSEARGVLGEAKLQPVGATAGLGVGRTTGLSSGIRLDLMTLPLNRCWCFVSVESLGSPPDSTATGARRHLLEGSVVKNPAAIIEGETRMPPTSPGSCLLTLAGFWTRGCSFDLLILREEKVPGTLPGARQRGPR